MSATRRRTVVRSDGQQHDDLLAVEEPLEVRVGFTHKGLRAQRSVAITMRTPGNDHELAVGFLFGERIVSSASDVLRVQHCGEDHQNENVVRVDLVDGVEPDLAGLQRNFYTTSSCGVCGKSSLEALDLSGYSAIETDLVVTAETIHRLGDQLRAAQAVFEQTGGLHAAALFDAEGNLLASREDVGRHNAVDKLMGWAVQGRRTPLASHVLFLSGRASFELLQKALAAGIGVVCAVGAPSSLAVDLAERFGVTLVGFVRNDRFNVYSHGHRVTLD